MKDKLHNLIKLLLKFHKNLLDSERTAYEKKNGLISSNHEYFQLVVNHEDFAWLKDLLRIISSLDEESEKEELDIQFLARLAAQLDAMLNSEKESAFFRRCAYFIDKNKDLFEIKLEIVDALSEFIKNKK